jgi:hypothetical protein
MIPEKQTFFRLEKYDPFQGIATGVAVAEEVDRDHEILDYAASKPYFQAWSNSVNKDSRGLSWGNVRLQHNPDRPVGRLLEPLQFDDANKVIRCTVEIAEPQAKDFLARGILTGFSIGGSYVSKTPLAGGITRYIANPSEFSVVDRPCGPSAVFSVVKADGSFEERRFKNISVHDKLIKAIGEILEKAASPRLNPNMVTAKAVLTQDPGLNARVSDLLKRAATAARRENANAKLAR